MLLIKKLIKRLTDNFGWNLYRLSSAFKPAGQLLSAINYVHADTVFDIRANEGQFAKEIRQHGYSGKIIRFESLTSARKNLLSFASRDPDWQVHKQSAICDYNGNIETHIADNSVLSSILILLEPISVPLKAEFM